MGETLSCLSGHQTELLLLVTISAVAYLLLQQRAEKKELKRLLQQALERPQSPQKEVAKAAPAAEEQNQVYLKEQLAQQSLRNNSEHPIYKIAITGGPCGGKSTSLKRIHDDLTSKGFRVFMVPEVPTLVVQAGGMILMSKFNTQERIRFQSLLIRFQMYAEDYFTRLAQMSKSPSVLLCDRGTVDPAAYVSKEEFQAIMDEEGWSWVTLRDRRYDRIIFLTTAANGAEKFYTLENNEARHEGPELARHLDKRTLEAWTGHPHLTICPNVKGETFEQKIDRAVRAVEETVGLEMKHNRYEKFLVEKPSFPQDLKVQTSEIEEIYLVNEDQKWSEDKIKKRGQNNSYTYQRKYRSKPNSQGDFPQEIRKPLTSMQYVMLREEHADQRYRVVHRERCLFAYKDTSYSIDIYSNILGKEKIYILRFANQEAKDPLSLVPDFLKIEKDVRSDPQYSVRNIARIQ